MKKVRLLEKERHIKRLIDREKEKERQEERDRHEIVSFSFSKFS